MTRRAGSADLPLHGGRVPAWLGARMSKLGAVIAQAIIHHYGRDEFLRRLAHPFWFQSFGAVMGMDWHSSGITTSVMGALKRGLEPLSAELGLHVCGGRGRHSRRTPDELAAVGERTGLDGSALARASRLVAKVDSAALQDGFALYLHSFVVADDGRWVVIQQGMNDATRYARRYHWLSEGLSSFLDDPHAAIDGPARGAIVNLADRRADASRNAQLSLLSDLGPDGLTREFALLRGETGATTARPDEPQLLLPHLTMPERHDVRETDVVIRRLHGALAAAADRGPQDFQELLLTPGVGARTVNALAAVAEVIHGAPCRFSDPARFSLAHGGKDRDPYPVPTRVYDHTLAVLKAAMESAKLGQDERLEAIRRLDEQARRLERRASGPDFNTFVRAERAASHEYGGRSVFGWEPAQEKGRDSTAIEPRTMASGSNSSRASN
ncbi:hypothetical protein AA23498_2278 [Acetobacter nitrogenifigens DSM 23921 = NBRC 105050]|uniref:DUF763 domain-containing protein n=1 Tax=Acetobacter nitrogenifigens DSM 23921 = NBRC 105050 TaxID=1120919 RepID=A0A511X758_9PROT|nr:DUF763 domain-containing protein [Acetobacter nitrogenifigens]GBQ95314.1 hypothetical protein AA23498_2278 [Acetobacter nitrogenifigens DSM 23921 = NBRC 105050]GEN58780.1 hypothetical protein ANI02nite_06640 [Acetobacter nitrogenifigens DSM 23921 = NBRC 105050]